MSERQIKAIFADMPNHIKISSDKGARHKTLKPNDWLVKHRAEQDARYEEFVRSLGRGNLRPKDRSKPTRANHISNMKSKLNG